LRIVEWPIRFLVPLLVQLAAVSQAATLTGFAELPADTFMPGPTSGRFIKPANGRQPPFVGQQPVQGFSALLKDANGAWFALSDNGFGSRDNSADYLLSIYRLVPDFRTSSGGAGSIRVGGVIHLGDPDAWLPYPANRTDRQLTGADLDPESFHRVADGSYWIGEEFNPSLVHFSADGVMLAAPVKLAGLNSADNPTGEPANLPRSRGFEGMALSADGKRLYPMLEGALEGAPDGAGAGLNIYTFDIEKQQFVSSDANHPSYRYRLDEDATAIGDFTLFSQTGGLVIERDSGEGAKAVIKKIYRVDFEQLDADGFLRKYPVADLLNISDPDDLDRDGNTLFTFPFWTIEGLVVLDATTLAIVNDNNYPLGQARDNSGTQPDNNELILIEVDPLWD
jgi:hypothetical protein